MKTTRDCMYHSGSGAGKTRLMWNDGREIVWNHLVGQCRMVRQGTKVNYKT